jgi:hypothetical protein
MYSAIMVTVRTSEVNATLATLNALSRDRYCAVKIYTNISNFFKFLFLRRMQNSGFATIQHLRINCYTCEVLNYHGLKNSVKFCSSKKKSNDNETFE